MESGAPVNHESTKYTKTHEEIFLYKIKFVRLCDLRVFVVESF